MSAAVSHEADFSSEKVSQQIEQRRLGRRKLVRHGGKLCSKCLVNPPKSGGYCSKCHAEYEADRRKRERLELKRLRALTDQQEPSKGMENGQDKGSGRRGAPG